MDQVQFEGEEKRVGFVPTRHESTFFLTRMLIRTGLLPNAEAANKAYVAVFALLVLATFTLLHFGSGSNTRSPAEIRKMAIPAE